MGPAPGSDMPEFRRLEYPTYNPVERRRQYVSLDLPTMDSPIPLSESGRPVALGPSPA